MNLRWSRYPTEHRKRDLEQCLSSSKVHVCADVLVDACMADWIEGIV